MANDQDRRALLAIVLSLAVYLIWTWFFAPTPLPPVDLTTAESATSEAPEARVVVREVPSPIPVADRVADHAVEFGDQGWVARVHSANGAIGDLTLTEYTAAPVVTPIYSWVMSKLGGAEGGWEPYTGGTEPQRLLTVEAALVMVGAGQLDDDGAGGVGEASVYQVRETSDAVVATRLHPSGMRITKTYTPGATPYSIDVQVELENTGTNSIQNLWFGVADRMQGEAGRFLSTPRPLGSVDGSVDHVFELPDLAGAGIESFQGAVDWFGVGDRYFMSVLAPETLPATEWLADQLPGGRYGAFVYDPVPLDAGASRTHRFVGFVGPKNLDYLKELGHGLPNAVEFGWFGFFAKILLFLLKTFQSGVVNWGVAIILLTVFVKLIFYPLTQKAFASSQRMQEIQPELTAMKEKYADNRELQTQETMRLFKEHNVNPMGGCLPTLVQFPVWIALYNVMLYSVELYDTSFLYLQDLTAADPYGVIPTLYALLMIAQQRMMPMAGMDPAQQKILKMMPLVFAVFMFSFPSGLVLYFSVNMVLTILQQWQIKRGAPAPKTAAPSEQ